MQIGYGRDGFYSHEWLENLFVRLLGGTPGYCSVETITPEHQRLLPGDFIAAGPPDMLGGRLAAVAGWKVLAVELNRALVLGGWGAFVLEPLGDGATRLIVRSRGPGAWGRVTHYLFWEPAHFVMERRMLLGIKERAERLVRERGRPVVTIGGPESHERLARVARRPRCRLTHWGRKTGRRYEVTIWFLVDGAVVYLVTADRRRQWVRNVQARPSVELRVQGRRSAARWSPSPAPTRWRAWSIF